MDTEDSTDSSSEDCSAYSRLSRVFGTRDPKYVKQCRKQTRFALLTRYVPSNLSRAITSGVFIQVCPSYHPLSSSATIMASVLRFQGCLMLQSASLRYSAPFRIKPPVKY